MDTPALLSAVRTRRAAAGLSQGDLAARVGVSRQAIAAIEAGRQVPSTVRALQLARALNCDVNELFQISGGLGEHPRVADPAAADQRVALGRVDGVLVAHPVQAAERAADGRLLSASGGGWRVEPFSAPFDVDANLLVAGCAPLLGTLSERVGLRFRDTRATWISADSGRALELLARGLVHIAGVHLEDASDPDAHARAAKAALPGQAITIVTLARWRQGLVVAPSNPLGLAAGPELFRAGVRHVSRAPGSGARRVLERLARSCGVADVNVEGPPASDHAEVALRVRWGLADVGVAIEAEAISRGLDFIPLCEERFDLIVPRSRQQTKGVARLIDLVDRGPFRAEAARLPGYDLAPAGHARSVEAGPAS